MGQYWMCVNLDKKEGKGFGKLGEIYGTDTPTCFMWLITIPLSPLPEAYGETKFGTWAGDRIICIGDYARSMPKGVLTEQEATDMSDNPNEFLDSDEYNGIKLYEVHGASEDVYPDSCEWVLRNLTRKEYVRASAITLDDVPGRLHGHPGLGHALFTQICWSNDPSCSMDIDFDITKGEWAAHRLDIRALSHVEEEMEQDDWTDVSQAVAERVRRTRNEFL